jgi:hypothetical protein
VVAGLLSLRNGRAEPPNVVRVVAVGNMSCEPTDPHFGAGAGSAGQCQQQAVSDLAVGLRPDLLIGLGDYQFELPTAAGFRLAYGPSWGRLRDITTPVRGNQEYKVRDASTFTGYFGQRSGSPTGYWSYDAGGWHVVILNSNCSQLPDGCTMGSAQQRWLEADLAGTAKRCVLAAWHHPRWSNGIAGPDRRTDALYRTLYRHHVEILLSGHEADYERFGPLDPSGRPDQRGVRQYVVGTGGQAHYHPSAGDAPWRRKQPPVRSQLVDYDHYGVLLLELHADGWSWQFHAPGAGVLDHGSATCR